MDRIGFIGLGVMGFPMAGHLSTAGYEVSGYNRTVTKSELWLSQYGGRLCHTPKDCAEGADYVFVCVGDDDDVRSVVGGDTGVLAGISPGSDLIDHTTTSAVLAREISAICTDSEVYFLDAPVSGGQVGAENGTLTVMCGGTPAVFKRSESVIGHYSRACVLMGDVGAGQLTKMVNQICVASIVQGLAEGINFGQKVGLDMEKVLSVLSKGAGQSWQMENRLETMCKDEFDFGFAVDLMRKDLKIVMAEADTKKLPIPGTRRIEDYYEKLHELGRGKLDTSSLIKLLR